MKINCEDSLPICEDYEANTLWLPLPQYFFIAVICMVREPAFVVMGYADCDCNNGCCCA